MNIAYLYAIDQFILEKILMKNIIFVFFCVLLIVSCATKPIPPDFPEKPITFNDAVIKFAQSLLNQVRQVKGFSFGDKSIIVNTFIDAATGQPVEVSSDIMNIFVNESNNSFKGDFKTVKTSADEVEKADYVVMGIIKYSDLLDTDKRYRIAATVVDLDEYKIVAKEMVKILETELPYKPSIPSPTYYSDVGTSKLITIATGQIGDDVDRETLKQFLTIHALLSDAEAYYNQLNYYEALNIYRDITQREGGEVMRAYGGLYATYLNLQQRDEAEKAFDKLVQLGIKNRSLSLKFVFNVNSLQFGKDEKNEFPIWIKYLGQNFQKNQGMCVEIEGHASKTGEPRYNEVLSYCRAQAIQEEFALYFPDVHKRTNVIGRGFYNTIVGSGTDDERDEIDRRVQFKFFNCTDLNTTNYKVYTCSKWKNK